MRLHDNLALTAANRAAFRSKSSLLVVFVVDNAAAHGAGLHRKRFISDALFDFDANLQRLGQRLVVFEKSGDESNGDVWRNIAKNFAVREVHCELCNEPYGLRRDHAVIESLASIGISLKRWANATLTDPRRWADVPLTMATFQKDFKSKMGGAVEPVEAPRWLIAPPREIESQLHTLGVSASPTLKAWRDEYANDLYVQSGETAALATLRNLVENRAEWLRKFEKPQTSAVKESTSMLSPHLKFGTLSVRHFYAQLRAVERDGKHSEPPVSMVGQLLWREFYMLVAAAVGENFGRIQGNAVCRQIAWQDNDEWLAKWRDGQTGFPFIDASMRKLARDGWLHHLARHSVACFATRGQLWLPWPKCAAVFEERLLDGDYALNNGNWHWLSCSAFYSRYFRVYSPVAFGKKYKPDSFVYIRHYCPELADMPDKYLLEPWKAPLAVQQQANCIIGRDYPVRMVDHDEKRAENLAKMKAAYADEAQKAQVKGRVPFAKPFVDAKDNHQDLMALLAFSKLDNKPQLDETNNSKRRS